MNTICLIGNLTRDPEKKVTPTGTDICNFTVAVQRRYKDKASGNYESDFIRCTAFRAQADMIAKHFQKGSRIGIIGSVHTDTKTGADGKKTTYTEVWVDSVDFCEGIKKKEEPAQTTLDLDDPFEGLTPIDESELPF